MDYSDETLSFEERAKALVEQMTVEECAAQMLHAAGAVERLGIPAYNWWNEALHGVARAGMATVFPQAIGMAASFDEDLLFEVADVISTEGRAKYNMYQKYEDYGIYKGITFWSPNVNIFRDPRWGRGQETYGEDPYLTARLGAAFVKGLQGDDPRYLKTAACAKHFAVHSGPEKLRHEFDAVVSKRDMAETYLPAFKALVDAGVEGFMGAYNRCCGEPCCGSKTLLKDILRDEWNFKGYVTSDCWAIADFHLHHKITDSPVQSVKLALDNKCDLNCGCTYEYILLALYEGLITEEQIRESAVTLMTTRMKLGMFDKSTPFDSLGLADVDTKEHQNVNMRMARESLVLLKNDGILPLEQKQLKTVSVIGPNANSIAALEGNYHGTANQYHTVLESIRARLEGVRVLYSEGCHLYEEKLEDPGYVGDRLGEVKAMADASDLVILVTGLDETIEGEEMAEQGMAGDKADLYLPKSQQLLVDTVCARDTPVILVNLSGSAIDFGAANEKAAAIVQAWYPGAMGGEAIAQLLFGEFSPSGKLPVTFYCASNHLPDFTDYSMENRTYKYLKEKPLYPFGFGLSYTTFSYDNLQTGGDTASAGKPVDISIDVTNTGEMDSDTVVQVYVENVLGGSGRPIRRLGGFRHISLKRGETKTVSLRIPAEMFSDINEEGIREYPEGTYRLSAGGCQPDSYSIELNKTAPMQALIRTVSEQA